MNTINTIIVFGLGAIGVLFMFNEGRWFPWINFIGLAIVLCLLIIFKDRINTL